MNGKDIVTLIGSGRGLCVVVEGLRRYPDLDLATIVDSVDDLPSNCREIPSYLINHPNNSPIQRIIHSDLVIICPGRLDRTISLVAQEGIPAALKDARGNCVYLCMLTAPYGLQIALVNEVVGEIEKNTSSGVFNYVLYHQDRKSDRRNLSSRKWIKPPLTTKHYGKTRYIGLDLIAENPSQRKKDFERPSHDPLKTAQVLYSLISSRRYYYSSVR